MRVVRSDSRPVLTEPTDACMTVSVQPVRAAETCSSRPKSCKARSSSLDGLSERSDHDDALAPLQKFFGAPPHQFDTTVKKVREVTSQAIVTSPFNYPL